MVKEKTKTEDSKNTGSHTPTDITGLKSNHIVRWYVLVLPVIHRGSASYGLAEEAARRIRLGEPTLEYFAPTYAEMKHVKGKLVYTQRPLLYNYVFVHSSVYEIFRMKERLPQYNFLPRIRDGKTGTSHYPYLSDDMMKNLQWIARSYSDVLPVYSPTVGRLMKGDKVHITEGQFKGAEATVVIQPGAGQKDIMVCIENWMWVPLLHVLPGQYEVISLNTESKHTYTNLDNERIANGLHLALQRFHGPEGIRDEDRRMAEKVLQQYGKLQMDTDVMRCKLYSLLLPAYTLLSRTEELNQLMGAIQAILPAIKAEQSKALLLVTLYGCTNNSIYHDQAHQLVDEWRKESQPKKNKQLLIHRLDDYDLWLGHR